MEIKNLVNGIWKDKKTHIYKTTSYSAGGYQKGQLHKMTYNPMTIYWITFCKVSSSYTLYYSQNEVSILSLDYFFTDKIVITKLLVTHIYDRSCGVSDSPSTCRVWWVFPIGSHRTCHHIYRTRDQASTVKYGILQGEVHYAFRSLSCL